MTLTRSPTIEIDQQIFDGQRNSRGDAINDDDIRRPVTLASRRYPKRLSK